MNGRQILTRVEMPLAMPLIWAGIRTATVAVVATATLAAYVDSGGFGRYIVDGFAVQDQVKVFVGGLLVALLAVGLELILASVQRRVVSPGLAIPDRGCLISVIAGYAAHQPHSPVTGGSMSKPRTSRSVWKLVTVGLALALLPTALFAGSAGAQAKSLTVGSKDFSGAQVVSQAYGQALEAKGYDINFKDNIGADRDRVPRARRTATSTRTPTTRARCSRTSAATATGDSATNYRRLLAKLKGTDIVASKPAPAVDVNGFYVTKATAKKYKLKTRVGSREAVRASSRSAARPSARSGRSASAPRRQQLYGFEFKSVSKLDPGGPLTVQALEDGDIDVALLFTGSSVIPKDAVLLTDDKGLQPADNPVFLMRKDKATPAALKIVNAVSAKLTTAAYNKMSTRHHARTRKTRPTRRRRS